MTKLFIGLALLGVGIIGFLYAGGMLQHAFEVRMFENDRKGQELAMIANGVRYGSVIVGLIGLGVAAMHFKKA